MLKSTKPKIYGLSAEFSDPDDLIHAAEKAKAEGYRRMDAYTPFPVHGMSEAIGFEDHKVEWTVFIAANHRRRNRRGTGTVCHVV